jgi:hypothetical protein
MKSDISFFQGVGDGSRKNFQKVFGASMDNLKRRCQISLGMKYFQERMVLFKIVRNISIFFKSIILYVSYFKYLWDVFCINVLNTTSCNGLQYDLGFFQVNLDF